MRAEQSMLTFCREPEVAPRDRRAPRDYQRDAIAAARAEWAAGKKRTAIVLHCGAGKTLTMAETMREELDARGGRGLWLANRDFLVKDARKRLIEQTGESVGVEKAELRAGTERIVVASCQTLHERRLKQWAPDTFSVIVYDECFVAGTLVDGRPIETIQPGDEVTSIDHGTGATVRRNVVCRMAKRSADLWRLAYGGNHVTCTGNHPYFVKGRGYVEAKDLCVGDLLCLRRATRASAADENAGDLWGREVQAADLVGNYGAHESRTRIGQDALAQSYAAGVGQGQNAHYAAEHWPQATDQGREWYRTDASAIAAGQSAQLGYGGCSQNGTFVQGPLGTPELLQAGCRQSGAQDWDRGGQLQPLLARTASPGREEGYVLVWSRLDSIARDERGGSEGRLVYNLEVEGAHTYFAAGALVHNCHHAPSKGSRAILDHFETAVVLGGTATFNRHDKLGMHNVFESIAYERGIDVGVEDGYFVPIVPVARYIDGVDFSKMKTTAGDLNLGELEEEMARVAAPIARAAVEEMGDRPCIVYTPGVASAHAVAATLNDYQPSSARAVDADTPDDERDRVLAAFDAGELQWIVNCGIYLEGLDVPKCRGIVIARPTKSESLYIQMAGRGGRPEGWIGQLPSRGERVAAIAASAKPNFLLLDITGHAGRHSLCSAATLAGKDVDQNELAKVIKDNPGLDVHSAAKEARAAVARQQAAIARAAKEAEVIARRSVFDVFKKYGLSEPDGQAPSDNGGPLTVNDEQWLGSNKIPATGMSHADVLKLQKTAAIWRKFDFASFRQRRTIGFMRLPTPHNLPWSTAKEVITRITAHWDARTRMSTDEWNWCANRIQSATQREQAA